MHERSLVLQSLEKRRWPVGRLADVERMFHLDEPISRRSRMISVTIYLSRRFHKRWCDVMPERSLSWFVRESMERFLNEMAELPRDAMERACRLIADDLAKKRYGPILKKNVRE